MQNGDNFKLLEPIADALGRGIEVDDLATQVEHVLGGRLGAELGADAQQHVGVGEQLLKGGLITAAPGRQRMIARAPLPR